MQSLIAKPFSGHCAAVAGGILRTRLAAGVVVGAEQPSSPHYKKFDSGSKITRPVASSAHVADDSVFSDRHNEVVNQGTSVLGKGQPSSSQRDSGNRMLGLLASSVHLTVVHCEYENPVHSNSVVVINILIFTATSL